MLVLVPQLYGGRDRFPEGDCIHDGMYGSGLRRMLFLVTVIQSYLGGGAMDEKSAEGRSHSRELFGGD